MSYATRAALQAKFPSGVDIEDLSEILDQVEDACDVLLGPAAAAVTEVTEAFRWSTWRAVERLGDKEEITGNFGRECVDEYISRRPVTRGD